MLFLSQPLKMIPLLGSDSFVVEALIVISEPDLKEPSPKTLAMVEGTEDLTEIW